jgi:negative regulator of replication initiation
VITKPNQKTVVRFLSFVQNLAEIHRLTFANQTQPEKVVRFFSFFKDLAEINQLTFANQTQPNTILSFVPNHL